MLQEEEEARLENDMLDRERFHEKEAPIDGGWGWGSIEMRGLD